MGKLIYKYDPFWQEIGVKSLILRWPLRPVGLLFCFDSDIQYFARVYHHEAVCLVHSWSLYNVDFGHEFKILEFLRCLCIWSVPYALTLAYHIWQMDLSNTRQCVAYIHNPNTLLTFYLKIKFIGCLMWLRVWATAFFSFDTLIQNLSHECITMWQCVIVTLTDINSRWIITGLWHKGQDCWGENKIMFPKKNLKHAYKKMHQPMKILLIGYWNWERKIQKVDEDDQQMGAVLPRWKGKRALKL